MNISQLLQGLLGAFRANAGPELLALITSFNNSLAANPTQINVVAQSSKFVVGVLAIIPGLEQSELLALAGVINTEAAKLLTPVAVATPAAAK
jgi:hypothetical protein